jgi:serine phosphatase RsbU (regulator of sigma subunit)
MSLLIRFRLFKNRILNPLIICLVFISGTAAGQINESGSYPIYNFSPKDYKAHEQNWCAVQDQRGIMYIGNGNGVMEYDGVNWNLLAPSNRFPVFSLALDDSGRVFFGSFNEFGYLLPDSLGRLEYKLLSDLLSEDQGEFDEIWETHIIDDKVIFQSFNRIFIWDHDSIEIVYSEEEINSSFFIRDKLFLSFTDKELSYLNESEILPIKNGKIFSDYLISDMIEISNGNIIIATEKHGFYSLDFEGDNPEEADVRKIETKNESLFHSLDIYNLQSLGSNRISMGTWGNGVIITDSLFNIVAVIDKNAGLQDDIVQAQFADQTGNLWLALSNGISRIEPLGKITHFSDESGLDGTVQSIVRFNGRIYVSTNIGLFYMDQEIYNIELSSFSQPKFKPVEGIEFECWDLISYNEGDDEVLLILTNDEIYELTNDHRSEVIMNDFAFELFQSKRDPKRMYVGLDPGLKSLYRQNGRWIDEGQFEDVYGIITDFSEIDASELWVGTEEEGILKINFQDKLLSSAGKYNITHYNQEQGLPGGPFVFSQFKGNSIFATNKGIFRYDREKELFFADSIFGKQFADGSNWIHRISKDDDYGIYMVTYSEELGDIFEVGYLLEGESGELSWTSKPFSRISEDKINVIYQETNDIVWFGGTGGVYRFDQKTDKVYDESFRAYIRNVELISGRPLFQGAFPDDDGIQSMIQPESWQITLPYQENSVVFNYAAQPSEDETFNRYSYFLEGFDDSWSEWTKENEEAKKEYTNLHEGSYVFRLKARNIYGIISSESSYEFSIMAPWFRTAWAYIIYVIIAAVVVYLIVIIYTRRLRAIIRERTAEVVSQKEVIEVKNNDIMDSILYAEKIQRAMMPPEDDLGKMGLDGFILFQPLNIVSGDFYWLGQKDGKIITVAADCTGHGVPGAFMSMLGVAFLNNIVGAQGIVSAAEILDELRTEVIAALKQKGHEGEQKDGMDLALHVLDTKAMKLEFSGANNPLILIRDNKLIQLKADRMPIGIHVRADEPFQNQVMDLQKGDVIYTFSDGYQDQFGGPKNKKFMIKRLKELFLEIHSKPMSEQKEILEKTFYDWIVPYGADQIDDVIVIGIRV